ncbi:MAG: alternative oxidase [Acidimicrobiia bacterium]
MQLATALVDPPPRHPSAPTLATLSRDQLALEHRRTLDAPRRRYGVLSRSLFTVMDLVYGKGRTLPKFKVLEVVARVPYQAWEQVGYIAITHRYSRPPLARRIFERVEECRSQQDNEQWHLLILEELIWSAGLRQGTIRYRLLPQVLAFAYHRISCLLYTLKPELSYGLNADFEDHAEHEYAQFVAENPQLESTPWRSLIADDYGRFDSVADLLRQISFDERVHKEESLARLGAARFS